MCLGSAFMGASFDEPFAHSHAEIIDAHLDEDKVNVRVDVLFLESEARMAEISGNSWNRSLAGGPTWQNLFGNSNGKISLNGHCRTRRSGISLEVIAACIHQMTCADQVSAPFLLHLQQATSTDLERPHYHRCARAKLPGRSS